MASKVLPGLRSIEKKTICYWFAEFKRGRTDTDDGERSSRLIEVVTPENIIKVHKLVTSDRRLKLCEIAEIVKISECSVFIIMQEHLTIRKSCSKWVPRLLTVDQKQQRVEDSEQCLAMVTCNKSDILR